MPRGLSVRPINVDDPPPLPQAANTRAVPAPFPCTHWLAVIAAGVSVRPVKVDDPPPPPPAAQLRPVAVLVSTCPVVPVVGTSSLLLGSSVSRAMPLGILASATVPVDKLEALFAPMSDRT